MIVALRNHAFGRVAVEIFEQMKARKVTPDVITFIGLLIACSHAGLVGEGLAYFNCMKETYGVLPMIEHLSCLIDLLGRAGRLEEAEGYVDTSPFGNNPVIWGNLVFSCRLHRDVLGGEELQGNCWSFSQARVHLMFSCQNYMLRMGDGTVLSEGRKLLKGRRVKKKSGDNLIAMKDVAEKFTVGDFSHARTAEILETPKILNGISENVFIARSF